MTKTTETHSIQADTETKATIQQLFDRKNTGLVHGLSMAFLFSLPQRPLMLFAHGQLTQPEISVQVLPGQVLKFKSVSEGCYQATELQALHCSAQNPAPLSLSALWLEQAELLTAELSAAFLAAANQNSQSSPSAVLAKILHEI